MTLRGLPSQWTDQGTWNILKSKLEAVDPVGMLGPVGKTLPVEPAAFAVILSYTLPSDGAYIFDATLDTEPNEGYLVLLLSHPEMGTLQQVTHSGFGTAFRIPASMSLHGQGKKGTVVTISGRMVAPGAGIIQSAYLGHSRLGD